MPNIDRFITDTFLALAREAGGMIQASRADAIAGASRKGDGTWVTEADRASERYLTARLREAIPNAAIIGEELARPSLDEINSAMRVIAIDPLDGTSSFRAGIAYWSVALGVIERSGRPSTGVVVLPDLEERYVNESDSAFHNGREVNTAAGEAIDSQTIALFPSDLHRELTLEKYPGRIRSLGCASVHICLVASGQAQFALLRAHLWDIAGPMAILAAAGGIAEYVDGSPLNLTDLYDGARMKKYAVFAADEPTLRYVQDLTGGTKKKKAKKKLRS